jgi:hypothetical protein
MKRMTPLLLALVAACTLAVTLVSAQTAKPKPGSKALPVVFAVLNDGKIVEPIGYLEKGKLAPTVDGASEAPKLAAFNRQYYKPATTYRLIFGGADAGTITIKSSDPKAECIANTAQVTFASTRAKLKGNVMGLATNAAASAKASGVRRLPTVAERTEIEVLVRAELAKQKVAESAAKDLKYHNLTSLDVDNDGTIEQVGTFWVDTGTTSRALLFFIAFKNSDGKYTFGHTDFRNIEQKDVMSSDIKDVDTGVYHERLLDVFDIDNDGVAEVFTYIQSFEGAGFNAYKRAAGKWTNVFEGSNYHCGY